MPSQQTLSQGILCHSQTTESQREIINAIIFFGHEGNLAFNESLTMTFNGLLEEDVFQLAVNRLVKRHDALRTTFDRDGQKFYVHKNLSAQINVVDLSKQADADEELKVIEREAVANEFDIFSGPLVRVSIVKMQNHHAVVLSVHHIVCDGWSFAVLLEDLARIYTGLVSGTHMRLPEAHYYIDFLNSITDKQHQESQSADYDYWLKLYSNLPAVLDLPVDNPRQAIRSLQSNVIEYQFDLAFCNKIRALAKQQRCSVVTVLLAAYASLMYKLSGQRDIVIALPAAGQAIEGWYRVIGHCVNTLPVPCYVDPEVSSAHFLQSFKETFLDLSEHQRITLGGLLNKLNVERDMSRLPLASLMFNLDQDIEKFEFAQLEARIHLNGRLFENFDLFVNVVEKESGFLLQWQFNSALFEQGSIETWAKIYHKLLQQMCEHPELPVDSLEISLDQDCNHQQLKKVMKQKSQHKQNLIQQLMANNHVCSDKIAVISGNQKLSYKQLDGQSNQLANFLIEKNIKKGELIGVCMERSIELIPALMAIWKCGCAYVPLDPSFPEERLNYMVSTSELNTIICQSNLTHLIDQQAELNVLCIDQLAESINNSSNKFTPVELSPEALAYVIFTSGSSGKPKGVMVPQFAVANFIDSMAETPGMGSNDKLLSVTTLSFDISTLELFLPLWVGGTVVIASTDESKNPVDLIKLINSHEITIMQATPSTWQMLLNGGWQGSKKLKMLCGGEAFPQELAKKILPNVSELWNMYGPTETTVWSTCFQIINPDDPILIGTPIKNTQCYIFDQKMNFLPDGFIGELCIGGTGVSSGYLNQAELTNERFVSNPIDDSSSLIYRTGDKARWNHNGQLEIYGRMDNQVKLRGYRIEPGEIESIMRQHERISDCAVAVKEEREGDMRLVAYVVWNNDALTMTELRQYLRNWVPAYMIPQHIMDMTELPLTPNGKLDRKNLPDMFANVSRGSDHADPISDEECWLADIWKKVIGVDKVGLYDNFFELGGHSLLTMQVINQVAEKTSIILNPRDLLLETLEHVAKKITINKGDSNSQTKENDLGDNQKDGQKKKGIKGIFNQIFK